jgi:hypothetical protein
LNIKSCRQEDARDEEYYRDGVEALDEFKREKPHAQPYHTAAIWSQSNSGDLRSAEQAAVPTDHIMKRKLRN